MKAIYHFVVSSQAWEPKFHENFFVTHNAFTYGLMWAAIIGIIVAVLYYFACCNSKNTTKMASLPAWCVAGVLAAALTFLVADWVLIGKSGVSDRNSMFYTYSFYNANETYYNEQSKQNMKNEKLVKELAATKQKIQTELNQGNDVRMPYTATTTVLSIVFFCVASFCVKGATRNGKHIPVKWPSK